jgi:hypothetical protein
MDKLGKGIVMRLHKSIYGLKQASQVWYQKFSGVLTSLGLQKSLSDNAMFHFKGTWRNQFVHCILVIHVDDGMGGCNSAEYLAFLKAGILEQFGLKDLGPVKCFLGVQFERSRATKELWIHQRDYVEALLTDYGLQDCSPVGTPMDRSLPFGDPDDVALSEPYPVAEFQGMMGRLLFLCLFSRPDCNYAVNRLTQFNSCPQVRHSLAAKRILRYLAGTRNLCLQFNNVSGAVASRSARYGSGGGLTLVGFSDSDWGGETSRHSTTGYAWFYNNSLIDWCSRKQSTIALSSTEAEYMAIGASLQNGIWLRTCLDESHIPHSDTTPICVDNQGAISLSNNSVQHSRTKHIDIKYHFIREHTNNNSFSISWIPSTLNTADIFTKPLERTLHNSHVAALGLVSR